MLRRMQWERNFGFTFLKIKIKSLREATYHAEEKPETGSKTVEHTFPTLNGQTHPFSPCVLDGMFVRFAEYNCCFEKKNI